MIENVSKSNNTCKFIPENTVFLDIYTKFMVKVRGLTKEGYEVFYFSETIINYIYLLKKYFMVCPIGR